MLFESIAAFLAAAASSAGAGAAGATTAGAAGATAAGATAAGAAGATAAGATAAGAAAEKAGSSVLADFGEGFLRKNPIVRNADKSMNWGSTLSRLGGRYTRYKTEKELRKTEEGNALADFGGVFLDE